MSRSAAAWRAVAVAALLVFAAGAAGDEGPADAPAPPAHEQDERGEAPPLKKNAQGKANAQEDDEAEEEEVKKSRRRRKPRKEEEAGVEEEEEAEPKPPKRKRKPRKSAAEADGEAAPPPETVLVAEEQPDQPTGRASVRVVSSSSKAWVVFPAGILVVAAAMHIYDPTTFEAGGLVATLVGLCIPAAWVQFQDHPETPNAKLMNRLHHWLHGGGANAVSPRSRNTTPNTSFSGRGGAARPPDWWTGGGVVGSKAEVHWQPEDMNVATGRKAKRAARETEAKTPSTSPFRAGRSLQLEAADVEMSPTSVGCAGTPSSHSPALSERELGAALDQVQEAEELARLRLQRIEGEDRIGMGRHAAVECEKRRAEQGVRELVAYNEVEAAAREGVEAEGRTMFEGIRELEARCFEESRRAETRGRLMSDALTERGGVAAEEAAAFRRFCDAFYEEALAARTKPGRERIGREEAEGRMEVEDAEAGTWEFVRQAAAGSAVEAAALEQQRRVAEEWAAAWGAAARPFLEGCEAHARSRIAGEHDTLYAPYAAGMARAALAVEETLGRRAEERGERRARTAVEANYDAGRLRAALAQGVNGLVQHEVDHRRGLRHREERGRLALDEARRRGAADLDAAAEVAAALRTLRAAVAALLEDEERAARAALLEAEAAAFSHDISAGAATGRADAEAREGERLAELRAASAALGEEEAAARGALADAERGERAAAAAAAETGCNSAAAAQAAREGAEGEQRGAVATEEDAHRTLYASVEAEARTALIGEFQTGRSALELQGMVDSIAATEAAVRADVGASEQEEREGHVQTEYAARMAVAEALIRNVQAAPKKAEGGQEEGKIVRMRVVAEQAQVRERYNIRSNKLGTLARGEVVHILEQKGNRGRCHEIEGWVSIRGQVGNVILQPVDEQPEGLALDDLPPPRIAAPAPAAAVATTPAPAAENFLPQVSLFGSSVSKGWSAFAGALGDGLSKPRKTDVREAPASAPAAAPIPATPASSAPVGTAETQPAPAEVAQSAPPEVTPPQEGPTEDKQAADDDKGMPEPAVPPHLETPVPRPMPKRKGGKAD